MAPQLRHWAALPPNTFDHTLPQKKNGVQLHKLIDFFLIGFFCCCGLPRFLGLAKNVVFALQTMRSSLLALFLFLFPFAVFSAREVFIELSEEPDLPPIKPLSGINYGPLNNIDGGGKDLTEELQLLGRPHKRVCQRHAFLTFYFLFFCCWKKVLITFETMTIQVRWTCTKCTQMNPKTQTTSIPTTLWTVIFISMRNWSLCSHPLCLIVPFFWIFRMIAGGFRPYFRLGNSISWDGKM